ncbi:helix-turn-helix domain-containing protein [Peptoniphilus catoniae]|uniref:helix-turn-helix domain-containing protein n=1 Tax=Peptoniphilus catoniae TaxID=1660341 RepID=UPI0010FEAB4D|nr:helix-turn-helix domain-containing protein [Peptoniphilus catoniae]
MGRVNYFSIMTAEVRYDEDLTANAKILYSEITALANKDGYCYANNNYFSKLYKVSNVTISRWISQLVDKGYIKRVIEKKEGSNEITGRRLYPVINEDAIEDEEIEIKNQDDIDANNNLPINNNDNTPINKNVKRPINKNVKPPINKNVKDNNTSINNTSINNNNPPNPPLKKGGEEEDFYKLILETWNTLPIDNIQKITPRRKKNINARIKEYSQDDFIKAIKEINNSSFLIGNNSKNWQITFDWFLRPNNFIKVLEKTYSNREVTKNEYHSNTDEDKRRTKFREIGRSFGRQI